MSMPDHFHPECPPDAHKVMRPPENEVNASLAVRVEDSELTEGGKNICDVLKSMSKTPLIVCSEKVREQITANAADSEIEPAFVSVLENGTEASIHYQDGAVGENLKFVDYSKDFSLYKDFLEELPNKAILCVDMFSMFIMRSLSTVYPWDKLLAQHFLTQYLQAVPEVTEEDKKLLHDVRYDRNDLLTVKDTSATAYRFLKLERKLFLQYPTEDD